MKKATLIIAAAMCSASALTAQNTSDILVGYDYTCPGLHDDVRTSKMQLLASGAEAKYFDEVSQWVDSLKATPGGEAKYTEILKKSCMTIGPDGSIHVDLSKGPSKKEHQYVFTNPGEGTVTLYNKFGQEQGYYTEPFAEMVWTIAEDSTATILGYECLMAETDYHGRHWTAWFTPEVPLPYGPWKMRGLPGLILKAENADGFTFTATGVQECKKPIQPMYRADDYSKVDRKKALADNEYFRNNMQSMLSAQGTVVKVYSQDKDGNRVEPVKYDGLKHSLEPDYKMK